MDTLGIHGIDASFKINEEEKKTLKKKIEAAKENVVIQQKWLSKINQNGHLRKS